MKIIAYLANSFPEPGEWYISEEIRELRRRGSRVISCSFRRPSHLRNPLDTLVGQTLYVLPLKGGCLLQGLAILVRRFDRISHFVWRAIHGPERLSRRLRTLVHTFLGACLAARLCREHVGHIHIHHGYFAAWAGMIAARLLDATYSMTLHGSDLLVRADYIDCKLKHSAFCITVSEFNRSYIREHYPEIDSAKILVHRLGVDLEFWRPELKRELNTFSILSVGRLHAVKNHEFLIRACADLKKIGIRFRCVIAGEGKERERLNNLICQLQLESEVELIGNAECEELKVWYSQADVVVFTSRSEGIPLAAMEAMAMKRPVLAPRITGIPELIVQGRNGFLYEPNSMADFLEKLLHIRNSGELLWELRERARGDIELNFNRDRNIGCFAADFLKHVDASANAKSGADANSLLQQVQLPV